MHGSAFFDPFECRPFTAAVQSARSAGADFRFLTGHWLVHHTRLVDCEGASPRWIEFDAVHECRPLLGGLGHIEEVTHENGETSVTMRFFDRASARWTAQSVSGRNGVPQGPLQGRFENGSGTFVGMLSDDVCHEASPTLIRETWSTTDASPRWERRRSTDGGATWALFATASFSRADW